MAAEHRATVSTSETSVDNLPSLMDIDEVAAVQEGDHEPDDHPQFWPCFYHYLFAYANKNYDTLLSKLVAAQETGVNFTTLAQSMGHFVDGQLQAFVAVCFSDSFPGPYTMQPDTSDESDPKKKKKNTADFLLDFEGKTLYIDTKSSYISHKGSPAGNLLSLWKVMQSMKEIYISRLEALVIAQVAPGANPSLQLVPEEQLHPWQLPLTKQGFQFKCWQEETVIKQLALSDMFPTNWGEHSRKSVEDLEGMIPDAKRVQYEDKKASVRTFSAKCFTMDVPTTEELAKRLQQRCIPFCPSAATTDPQALLSIAHGALLEQLTPASTREQPKLILKAVGKYISKTIAQAIENPAMKAILLANQAQHLANQATLKEVLANQAWIKEKLQILLDEAPPSTQPVQDPSPPRMSTADCLKGISQIEDFWDAEEKKASDLRSSSKEDAGLPSHGSTHHIGDLSSSTPITQTELASAATKSHTTGKMRSQPIGASVRTKTPYDRRERRDDRGSRSDRRNYRDDSDLRGYHADDRDSRSDRRDYGDSGDYRREDSSFRSYPADARDSRGYRREDRDSDRDKRDPRDSRGRHDDPARDARD